MTYKIIDDIATADIAVEITSESLAGVFADAAEVVLDIMLGNAAVLERSVSQQLDISAPGSEMLLFDFIGELLFLKDARELLCRPVNINIQDNSGQWHLSCALEGECIDRDRHDLRIDIKAVTLHKFKLEYIDNNWNAFVILDL